MRSDVIFFWIWYSGGGRHREFVTLRDALSRRAAYVVTPVSHPCIDCCKSDKWPALWAPRDLSRRTHDRKKSMWFFMSCVNLLFLVLCLAREPCQIICLLKNLNAKRVCSCMIILRQPISECSNNIEINDKDKDNSRQMRRLNSNLHSTFLNSTVCLQKVINKTCFYLHTYIIYFVQL